MSHDSLENLLRTNWSLLHHHKWSLADIDGMIPFERQIYVKMLADHLKEQHKQEGSQ